MKNNSIAIIIPIRNESKGLRDLLNSLTMQSLQPDEIIIIDTGSTDNSIEIIASEQCKNSRITLINSFGAFPGKARNAGIAICKSSIIVHMDGGCNVKLDWLEQLVKPILEEKADYVVGNVKPEKVLCKLSGDQFDLGWFIHTTINSAVREKGSFAGGASVAYRKFIWEMAEGQPDFLRVCEDVCFCQKIKSNGVKAEFAENSVCYWQVGPGLIDSLKRKFRYLTHELQLTFITSQIKAAFIRMFLLIISIILLIINPVYACVPIFTGILYWIRFVYKCKFIYYRNNSNRKKMKVHYALISFFLLFPIIVIIECSAILIGLIQRFGNGVQHRNIIKYLSLKKVTLLLFLCYIYFITPVVSEELSGLRDGIIYLRSKSNTIIDIHWKPTFNPGAFSKTLYLQKSDGSLVKKIDLSREHPAGSLKVMISSDDYKLEIPGLCFFEVSVHVSDSVSCLWQPAVLHLALAGNKNKFYFKSDGIRKFKICGKNHGGMNKLNISDPNRKDLFIELPENTISINENRYEKYEYLQIDTPSPGIWSISMANGGKGSFWLEGIDNYFVQDTTHFFSPIFKNGKVKIKISSNIVGPMAKLGGYLPEAELPDLGYKTLREYELKNITLYAGEELYLKNKSLSQVTWYNRYKKENTIDCFYTIIAIERGNFLQWLNDKQEDNLKRYSTFVNKFINMQAQMKTNTQQFYTFYDEPNTKFKSPQQYAEFYAYLKKSVSVNDQKENIKFSGPESANMLQGASRADAKDNLGIHYTEALLKKDWNLIDAISWHQWGPYDLIATEEFHESIEAAMKLSEKYRPAKEKNKQLIISQTNMASGPFYTPHQQETFFAALWFVSTLIQSCKNGELAMYCWFPFFGMENFRKGVIEYISGGIKKKPLTTAYKFVNDHLLSSVLKSDINSVDIEVLPMYYEKNSEMSIFLLNKSKRSYNCEISLELPEKFVSDSTVEYYTTVLDSSLSERKTDKKSIVTKTPEINLHLDSETISVLSIKSATPKKQSAK